MNSTDMIKNYLAGNHVEFVHRRHCDASTAHQVAVAEHISDQEVAKTVLLQGQHGFVIAVLGADCEINFAVLREKLNSASVNLADEEVLAKLFPECETGAMPPFGNFYGLPVLMDRKLAEDSVVMAFNAGTHRDAIHMATEDFRRLVNPFVFSFARQRV